MGKTLYLECNSGISGDMTVGALLDLGADVQHLEEVLSTVKAEGFKVAYTRVKKAGLDCMDFDVILDAEHDGHDHDMDYLYGHLHEDEYTHHHSHHHDHEHSHEEHEHTHHYAHRGMKEINEILDAAVLSDNARRIAKNIFEILAKAESKAHGVPIDQVHFHEVGALIL